MSNGESGIQKVLCFRRRGDLIIDMIISDRKYDMYFFRFDSGINSGLLMIKKRSSIKRRNKSRPAGGLVGCE
jgi:hypothetical protein